MSTKSSTLVLSMNIKRYLDKLCPLERSVKNDPYVAINSKHRVNDMSLWPPVEHGHIFCCFVDRPGSTKEAAECL